jgi:hypothetical protein
MRLGRSPRWLQSALLSSLRRFECFIIAPRIDVYVGDDLIDRTSFPNQLWLRGKIKNIGDRGVERCRLKLLKVEGKDVPEEAGKVQNGFLQWQGGICDSMRLNPDEYWIFDIGFRARAYFVGKDLLSRELPLGSYRLAAIGTTPAIGTPANGTTAATVVIITTIGTKLT